MRLACVKRAASVDSEPGSNSRLNRLFNLADHITANFRGNLRHATNRSLQFEFKLLTKFLHLFTHDACASYATSHSTRLSNICASQPSILQRRITCRPRKPFGRNQTTLDQNSARYGSVQLQPENWESERTSSERGLSGLQSEDTAYYRTSFTASCCQPYPNNANLVLSGAHCINYSSKLMSAAQELFQLFLVDPNPPRRSHTPLLLRSSTKLE